MAVTRNEEKFPADAERAGAALKLTLATVSKGSIVLKNSTRKYGRKNFGHEKATAVEFLTATSFNTTLVVKRFLKIDTSLISE